MLTSALLALMLTATLCEAQVSQPTAAAAVDRGAAEGRLSPEREGAVRHVPEADNGQRVAAGDVVRFLAGGLAGLAIHEGGHVATGYLFSASPGVRGVTFGPIPFFAITHRSGLSPRREFLVSSAGFWMQNLGSEVLLTAMPDLRYRHAPVAKGLLAFDVLTSAGYAVTALAKVGPVERDTRGMAAFIGGDEGWTGAIVLAPAVFDVWRYYRPDSRWAPWLSRAAKAGLMALVMRGAARQGR